MMAFYNSDIDLVRIKTNAKFGQNASISSESIGQKHNSEVNQGP